MKRYVLSAVLMSMLVPTAAFCQEFGEEEDIERQMELHGMELEMQHREAEMDLERQRRELELERQKIHLDRERRGPEHPGPRMHHPKKELGPLLLLCLVVHILVAVWVYTDIRRLNRGSGVWIVITLLTGLLGGLVYAVVRLGDERQKGS
ncbi:MAG: hypothetical protein PVJ86_10975 [Phycisphaerales bacterium]|jgi:hypothetical protein